MAETEVKCADDLEKHVMKVFEEATKDCEDKELNEIFDMIRNYDDLNEYAISVFNSMANDKFIEVARELFKPRSESESTAVLPDVAIYTVVIWACISAGKIMAAHRVYHHMIANGVAPTSCTYIILINTLATNSSSDVSFVGYAKKYFLEMLDKGMTPISSSYMAVFKAIARQEPVEKAREFLEQIQTKGFSPKLDVPHFDVAYMEEAMNALKMSDVLINATTDNKLQKLYREWSTTRKPLRDEFPKMYKALKADGNDDQAMELYRRAWDTNIIPEVVLHTGVIEDCLKAGNTECALKAYRTMLATGVAPNSYTYTVLIKGLTADPHFVEDAKKCLLEMMDKGMRPNAATYTAVIEGFARQEDKEAEEEGKQFVEVMMDKGLEPNVKAMMEVLKGRPKGVIRRVISIVLSKLKG
ncbi:pentatricopeptide repeat-containing protein At5g65560-like [Rosa rugosa]|uniref:pentatricopeptide repeat-containing protein At5g65560-like n=1 Tax=Rosa rugosa TaxID=74645 RepID=UPI002B40BAC6|nr:pentatricopeptide repeat-containing protein At5g65560-like [Rosa rugosa]